MAYAEYLARGVPGAGMRVQGFPPEPDLPPVRLKQRNKHDVVNGRTIAQDNNDFATELLSLSQEAVPPTRAFAKNECAALKTAWLQLLTSGSSTAQNAAAAPKLSFSEMHSAQAAQYFTRRDRGCKVSIMNFANGESPGGGYNNGARAQEEDLCRQFPLYWPSLARTMSTCYPFGPPCGVSSDRYSMVLVTHGLECWRADGVVGSYRVLERPDFAVDTFVAATAPAIRFGGDVADAQGLSDAIEHVIWSPFFDGNEGQSSNLDLSRLREAASRGSNGTKRVLILGAWGCGAFGNDPREMSLLFRTALLRAFEDRVPLDEVHFAIPVFNPRDKGNPIEYRKMLQELAAETGQELEDIAP